MTWVKTSVASEQLGLSSDYLIGCIYNQTFSEGIHFINISKGKRRPTYRWDIEAINRHFNPSTRKNYGRNS